MARNRRYEKDIEIQNQNRNKIKGFFSGGFEITLSIRTSIPGDVLLNDADQEAGEAGIKIIHALLNGEIS